MPVETSERSVLCTFVLKKERTLFDAEFLQISFELSTRVLPPTAFCGVASLLRIFIAQATLQETTSLIGRFWSREEKIEKIQNAFKVNSVLIQR
ncbi:hypothetical protein J6590_026668 [Homalodisca vitripennis]|nr:hypothetical protein J6590_026668 [Homalodisca vitripennis]